MTSSFQGEEDLIKDINSLLNKYSSSSQEKKELLEKFILNTVLYNWEDPEPEEIIPLSEGLEEIRNSLAMFKRYKYNLKISIFGSARTPQADDLYKLAHTFAQKAAFHGYKIITGAGPGIMEAGNLGAGAENSFGLGLKLPFENASSVFDDHPQNITMFKHFYSRKQTFYRESQAIVVMPGGFGTMDEIFQGLASIQTGKLNIIPFILLDKPDGNFWINYDKWIRENLVQDNYIYQKDLIFYTVKHNADEALEYIAHFYKNYYSYFFMDQRLFMQLKIKLTPEQLGIANNYAIENSFSELVFVRERYFCNKNLYVYSLHSYDTSNFCSIKSLIELINTF